MKGVQQPGLSLHLIVHMPGLGYGVDIMRDILSQEYKILLAN